MAGEERRSSSQPTRRRERVIKQAPDQSHLSEEGGSPSGPEASFAGHPLYRYGGPLRRRDDPPNEPGRGNADEDAFSPMAGGAYYAEADAGAPRRQGAVAEGESPRRSGSQAVPPPRAARRSDRTIHEDVCELLAHHPEADAGDVQVQVEGGEVTLQGTVEDRDMRWLIEDLTESVSGVSLVHNRIRIAKR